MYGIFFLDVAGDVVVPVAAAALALCGVLVSAIVNRRQNLKDNHVRSIIKFKLEWIELARKSVLGFLVAADGAAHSMGATEADVRKAFLEVQIYFNSDSLNGDPALPGKQKRARKRSEAEVHQSALVLDGRTKLVEQCARCRDYAIAALKGQAQCGSEPLTAFAEYSRKHLRREWKLIQLETV